MFNIRRHVYVNRNDDWTWREDAHPQLAFAVHVLMRDGLRVPPFDRHPDGDRSFRDAGLDDRLWRGWLMTMLDRLTEIDAFAREAMQSGRPVQVRDRPETHALLEILRAPGSFCEGSAELRRRLNELWTSYGPLLDEWKRRVTGEGGRDRMAEAGSAATYATLSSFGDRLPTLRVYIVDYPVPVILTVPPVTALIAPAADPAGYADQVVEAARALAGFAATH